MAAASWAAEKSPRNSKFQQEGYFEGNETRNHRKAQERAHIEDMFTIDI